VQTRARTLGTRRQSTTRLAALLAVLTLSLTVFYGANSAPLLVDGFESGDFSSWTAVQNGGDGITSVQSQVVKTGHFAARLGATTALDSFAFARTTFTFPLEELTAEGTFRVTAEGLIGSNVPLFRLFDASGKRLISLYRQNRDNDKIWLQHGLVFAPTSGVLPLERWGHFQLSVSRAGTGSIEVRLDGTVIHRATGVTLDRFATLQIGNEVKGQAFSLVADDISIRSDTAGATPTTTPSTTVAPSPATTSTTAPPVTTTTVTALAAPTTTTTRPPALVTTTTTRPPAPVTTTTTAPAAPASASLPVSTGPAYYVDADSGDDSRVGTSPEQAWRTLARANKASLQPGERLLFERGGSWNGRLTLSASGTPGAPITVGAYGNGNRPRLSGGCLEVPGSHLIVTGFEVHDCSWAGVSITGAANRIEDNLIRNNIAGVAVRAGAMDNRILRNQIRDNNRMSVLTSTPWDDSGAFGVLLHGDRTEVAHNTISGSDAFSHDYGRDGAAIEIFGGRHSSIHHNQAFDNDAFAELGNSRSADNTFAYNLVRSSLERSTFLVTRGARSGWGPVLRTTVLNNTVFMTGRLSEGFVCDSGCGPDVLTLRNNIVVAVVKAGYADGAITDDHNLYWGGITQFPRGPHSLVADPRFVNPAGGDFRLRADSPAVDKGVPSPHRHDLDGAPVPRDGDGDGSAVADRGAYERQP
jgi:hypothetical protein